MTPTADQIRYFQQGAKYILSIGEKALQETPKARGESIVDKQRREAKTLEIHGIVKGFAPHFDREIGFLALVGVVILIEVVRWWV